MSKRDDDATLVDRMYQLAYTCAYRTLRTYWRIRRPMTHGALVAIWSRGQVLLVRNSYVPYYSAPGGYVRRGESGREAAMRELEEEVGVRVRPEQLELALEETLPWEGKRDHVQIFNLVMDERPTIRIDRREVIAASWFERGAVRDLDVFPPLKRVIESGLPAA